MFTYMRIQFLINYTYDKEYKGGGTYYLFNILDIQPRINELIANGINREDITVTAMGIIDSPAGNE